MAPTIMLRVDLGCGWRKVPGFIGTDISHHSDAEMLFDLNKPPYPFSDSAVDRIWCHHVIEHLDIKEDFWKEVHRVLKPGGRIEVATNVFPFGFSNVQHKTFYNAETFGTIPGFRVIDRIIRYQATDEDHPIVSHNRKKRSFLPRLIDALIRINPYFFTRVWSHWVGGAEEIHVVMERIE